MSRLSDRRVVTLFALVLASGLCLALLAVRDLRTGDRFYDALAWNLLLAWVPFVLALALYDAYRRDAAPWIVAGLGALWLVFLPNAPYIVTDFVHLGESAAAPLWFDGALIAAFAGTGLVLGLGSVCLLHGVVTREAGARAGWGFVLGVLALCGVGVYLGRFGRLNSWDVLIRPGDVLELAGRAAVNPLGHPEWLAFSLVFAAFLLVPYLLVYGATELRLDQGRGQ
jgi:uncharacterized membrane protein